MLEKFDVGPIDSALLPLKADTEMPGSSLLPNRLILAPVPPISLGPNGCEVKLVAVSLRNPNFWSQLSFGEKTWLFSSENTWLPDWNDCGKPSRGPLENGLDVGSFW